MPKISFFQFYLEIRCFSHQITKYTDKHKVAAAQRPKKPSNEAVVVVAKSARLDDSVVLVADQREVCGRGKSKSDMRRRLEKIDTITVNFITLNISDFCFLWRNQVRLLIERKRIDDLAASIKDKRYAEQKKRLKECATTRSIYLIEHKVSTLVVVLVNLRIRPITARFHFDPSTKPSPTSSGIIIFTSSSPNQLPTPLSPSRPSGVVSSAASSDRRTG